MIEINEEMAVDEFNRAARFYGLEELDYYPEKSDNEDDQVLIFKFLERIRKGVLVVDDSGEIKQILIKPLDINGLSKSEFIFQIPTAGDLRAGQRKNNHVDIATTLAARITKTNEVDLNKLSIKDYRILSETTMIFFME